MTEQAITTDQQLGLHVEAIEQFESEQADLADAKRDRYAALKSDGYDAPTVRKVVKLRKLEADKRRELEELETTYMSALGHA